MNYEFSHTLVHASTSVRMCLALGSWLLIKRNRSVYVPRLQFSRQIQYSSELSSRSSKLPFPLLACPFPSLFSSSSHPVSLDKSSGNQSALQSSQRQIPNVIRVTRWQPTEEYYEISTILSLSINQICFSCPYSLQIFFNILCSIR